MKRKTRILVLCKTYPSPSTKYAETSCVAGMDENGALIRLFLVPFRMVQQDQQFAKWQWIEALIEKSPVDHRPESHKIYVDTIVTQEIVPTSRQWCGRRQWLDKLPIFASFQELDAQRLKTGLSLGLLKPSCVTGLEVRSAKSDAWTPEEIDILERLQRQASLFDNERPIFKRLEKVPFDFYYHYECESEGIATQHKHKIVDC